MQVTLGPKCYQSSLQKKNTNMLWTHNFSVFLHSPSPTPGAHINLFYSIDITYTRTYCRIKELNNTGQPISSVITITPDFMEGMIKASWCWTGINNRIFMDYASEILCINLIVLVSKHREEMLLQIAYMLSVLHHIIVSVTGKQQRNLSNQISL